MKADEVHCTVFAPFEAPPGDCFLVQAFAHLARPASQLADRADDADLKAQKRGSKKLEQKVERGKTLSFTLHMPGLVDDAPPKSLVWDGEIDCVTFTVTIPDDFRPRTVAGTVTVAYSTVPIGEVTFTLKVVPAPAPQPAAAAATTATTVPAQTATPAAAPCTPPAPRETQRKEFKRFRRAFVSYASEDRDWVLLRVEMIEASGYEPFLDVITLKSGELWEPALYKYLEESDVFFLFWSASAKKSDWVKKEIEYALDLRVGDPVDDIRPAIIPIVIEESAPAPPRNLKGFQFSDKYLRLIKDEELKAPRRASRKSAAKAKPKPRRPAAS